MKNPPEKSEALKNFFHTMEKRRQNFPHHGKSDSTVSILWKQKIHGVESRPCGEMVAEAHMAIV